MDKDYVTLILSFILILISQISSAGTVSGGNVFLYDKAEAFLDKGDTLEACAIYRELRLEKDSVAQINYQNEIKVKRTTYQIDELYLENKQQEGVLLRRISLFLFITVLLFASASYYLHIHNRKLVQARLKAQQLKEEAELSIQGKSELLYTVSKEMTESLSDMKTITASMQATEAASFKEVRDDLSNLRSSAEKLQQIYNRIFS